MGLPNVRSGVRPGPNTALIWDTFVRLSKLNASTTRSSLPWGLMSKYFRIRRSRVADDDNRSALRDTPNGREVNGKARNRLSSPPVTTLTGVPLPNVKIGATSIWLMARVQGPIG